MNSIAEMFHGYTAFAEPGLLNFEGGGGRPEIGPENCGRDSRVLLFVSLVVFHLQSEGTCWNSRLGTPGSVEIMGNGESKLGKKRILKRHISMDPKRELQNVP